MYHIYLRINTSPPWVGTQSYLWDQTGSRGNLHHTRTTQVGPVRGLALPCSINTPKNTPGAVSVGVEDRRVKTLSPACRQRRLIGLIAFSRSLSSSSSSNYVKVIVCLLNSQSTESESLYCIITSRLTWTKQFNLLWYLFFLLFFPFQAHMPICVNELPNGSCNYL